MYFQILKVVLWPRKDADPRILSFRKGVVNVISGASKTGKSAVIPIIDYCLGSAKCSIPVGVIRDRCEWFGVVVETIEGEKLLARREPGDQQSTGDMYVLEAPTIEIPREIKGKNFNLEEMKSALNRAAGLSSLDFDEFSENGFKARPGFRDLMAFLFQPQNIVANPDILFYKADTTEHREKLKTIFPYVLGAITPRLLAARQHLEALQRSLRRKDAELRDLQSVSNAWMVEGRSWLQQAMEFGLTSVGDLPDRWEDVVDRLKAVAESSADQAGPSMAGIDSTLARLEALRASESQVARELGEHRQRLNELRRLLESSSAYGDAIRLQRDRLSLSKWIRGKLTTENTPLSMVELSADQKIQALCQSLENLEVQLRSYPAMSDTLDKELLRQRELTQNALDRLNDIRFEIRTYERKSKEVAQTAAREREVERFIGRLQQALVLYEQADTSSPLREEIDSLQAQIRELQAQISSGDVRRRLENALNKIQDLTGKLVPEMDAEWPDAVVRLNPSELTVQVSRGNRTDYLWEIGSGANWLAYHVAVTLALQKYFLADPHHPVPGLLIYDQPSQVYFPKTTVAALNGEEIPAALKWQDQDILAVRKVFKVLGDAVEAAVGRLQVIVLDHAGAEVWGNLTGVELREEWREDEKLVPVDWLQ